MEAIASRRKVSIETRQRFLETLGEPPGVVIARKPTDSDDVIEVRMLSSNAVPNGKRPGTFAGFHVHYQVVKVSRAGKW